MATKLEFKNSPQDVTIREKLTYQFALAPWLAGAETVSSATGKLLDEADGSEVAGAVSGLVVTGGNTVTLTVDWATAGVAKKRWYVVLIRAAIGTQFKEGFARFSTFKL